MSARLVGRAEPVDVRLEGGPQGPDEPIGNSRQGRHGKLQCGDRYDCPAKPHRVVRHTLQLYPFPVAAFRQPRRWG